MNHIPFDHHFQAAVSYLEPHAPTQEILIEAIEDRSYDTVDVHLTQLSSHLRKFEIDCSLLTIDNEEVAKQFKLNGYRVFRVADRRYSGNVNPDRLIVGVAPNSRPIPSDSAQEVSHE